MKLPAIPLLIVLVPVSGCDAWPTVLDNRSQNPIHFRYRESSHEEWSALFDLNAGEAQRLAREHWIQDIVGLRINDGGRHFIFDYTALEPLRRACSSWLLSRRLKFTPDCYITYRGNGRLGASFAEPTDLVFQNFGNGS